MGGLKGTVILQKFSLQAQKIRAYIGKVYLRKL